MVHKDMKSSQAVAAPELVAGRQRKKKHLELLVSCSVTARHWASIKQPARSCTPPARACDWGASGAPGLVDEFSLAAVAVCRGSTADPHQPLPQRAADEKYCSGPLPLPAAEGGGEWGRGRLRLGGWAVGAVNIAAQMHPRYHLTFGRSPMLGHFLPVSFLSSRKPDILDTNWKELTPPILGVVLGTSFSPFLKCSALEQLARIPSSVQSSRAESSHNSTTEHRRTGGDITTSALTADTASFPRGCMTACRQLLRQTHFRPFLLGRRATYGSR